MHKLIKGHRYRVTSNYYMALDEGDIVTYISVHPNEPNASIVAKGNNKIGVYNKDLSPISTNTFFNL